MKIKTSELIGSALDWAVAKAEDQRVYIGHNHTMTGVGILDAELVDMDVDGPRDFCPSRDWAQAGPIIDREKISVWWSVEHSRWTAANLAWMCAEIDVLLLEMPDPYAGPTRLIAAMRCYVASKLGDEIEVPNELAS